MAAVAAQQAVTAVLRVGADRDDVVQEGMIGLYQAICDFSAARGPSFRTFAEMCVTRQIFDAIMAANRRKYGPLNSSLRLEGLEDYGDCERERFEQVLVDWCDPCDVAVGSQQLVELHSYIGSVVSDFEREVLCRTVRGAGYREIAAALNVSVKSVDNALQRCRGKLRTSLDAFLLDAAS